MVGFVLVSILGTLAASYIIGKMGYGIYLVMALFGMLLALLVAVRPRYGAYMLVFFIFANLSDVLDDTFHIPDANKLWVGLTAMGLISRYIIASNSDKIFFRATEAAILAFTLTSLASLVVAGEHPDSINTAIDVIKEFIVIFIIVQLCSEEHTFKRASWLMIGTAAFLALLSVYQVISGDYMRNFWGLAKVSNQYILENTAANRVMGPLGDPNFYAMILLPPLIMAFYRVIFEERKIYRIFATVAAFLMLVAVVFTFSRGAIVSLAVVGGIALLRERVDFLKIGVLLIILVLVLTVIFPASFSTRLSSLGSIFNTAPGRQTESSIRGRSSETIVAVEMFYDHPVIGVGRGLYETYYLEYASKLGLDDRGESRQAHSLYFEAAAEQGLLGVIALGSMIAILWLGMNRARRTVLRLGREDLGLWISGVQLGLAGYLLTSVFLHDDYIRYLSLVIALAAASSAMAERMVSEHQLAERIQKSQSSALSKDANLLIDVTEA
jgi:O-antigen ligase